MAIVEEGEIVTTYKDRLGIQLGLRPVETRVLDTLVTANAFFLLGMNGEGMKMQDMAREAFAAETRGGYPLFDYIDSVVDDLLVPLMISVGELDTEQLLRQTTQIEQFLNSSVDLRVAQKKIELARKGVDIDDNRTRKF